MKCQECDDNLSKYYDGELPEAVAAELEAHLESCPTCCRELQTFQSLSAALVLAQNPQLLPTSGWAELVSRLENPSVSWPLSKPRSATWWSVAGLVMATAASALLLVWSSTQPDQSSGSEIAMDFSSVIESYANDPASALEALSDQYGGRELSADKAGQLLGYEPKAPRSLPEGTQVVSTHVLKLPECKCQAGKCSCGPGGCNCAAMLCRRSDGSEFVLIEHGESKRVSFGNLPARLLQPDAQQLTLLGNEHLLAASWVSNNRRVTAIGVRSDLEAAQLAHEALAKP